MSISEIFAQIVREHDSMLRRIASSYEARTHLAQELVQDIYFAIWKALPVGATGVLLGVATIGIGLSSGAWNFVTRGIAIVAMSSILTFALWSLRSVSATGDSSPLSQMIDLAISRAQRTLSLIRAGLYSCVIAAVFGLVGTAIRMHFDRPPHMSPIIDLGILALIALVLFLYRRQLLAELGKYRALRQALTVNENA